MKYFSTFLNHFQLVLENVNKLVTPAIKEAGNKLSFKTLDFDHLMDFLQKGGGKYTAAQDRLFHLPNITFHKIDGKTTALRQYFGKTADIFNEFELVYSIGKFTPQRSNKKMAVDIVKPKIYYLLEFGPKADRMLSQSGFVANKINSQPRYVFESLIKGRKKYMNKSPARVFITNEFIDDLLDETTFFTQKWFSTISENEKPQYVAYAPSRFMYFPSKFKGKSLNYHWAKRISETLNLEFVENLLLKTSPAEQDEERMIKIDSVDKENAIYPKITKLHKDIEKLKTEREKYDKRFAKRKNPDAIYEPPEFSYGAINPMIRNLVTNLIYTNQEALVNIDKHILLIDDNIVTGSSLLDAYITLLEAGFTKVTLLSMMKMNKKLDPYIQSDIHKNRVKKNQQRLKGDVVILPQKTEIDESEFSSPQAEEYWQKSQSGPKNLRPYWQQKFELRTKRDKKEISQREYLHAIRALDQ